MAVRKAKADETVETPKVRKPRDTTPVQLLSDIGVVDASQIPVGARQRSDNPFVDALKSSYDAGFEDTDNYATAEVDNVSRAVRQLHTAAQINNIGVRILVQDINGSFNRESTVAGTVWFRGKEKNARKSADDAAE